MLVDVVFEVMLPFDEEDQSGVEVSYGANVNLDL